jgi:perosamine synthetase
VKDVLHSKPWITAGDRAAVAAVLDSGMLAQGERTSHLENAVSRWSGAAGGVAVGSGSAAITLALGALGVGPGDEVVIPSYVCPSVMEAVLAAGGTPVLCDVSDDWVVNANTVSPHITQATRALLIPHMYGIFADCASFLKFGIPVIEDCAQAIGPPRTWPLSRRDVAVYSFHPTKLITTGEGGMVVAADPDLVERMRRLRDGTTGRDRARILSPLPDVGAALGLSQLARYAESLERRKLIATRYIASIEPLLPLGFSEYPFERSMFFRFPLRLRGGLMRFKPLFAARHIRVTNGVDLLLHRLRGLPDAGYPNSVRLFETTVSLPIYPALREEEVDRCIAAAGEILCHRTIESERLG